MLVANCWLIEMYQRLFNWKILKPNSMNLSYPNYWVNIKVNAILYPLKVPNKSQSIVFHCKCKLRGTCHELVFLKMTFSLETHQCTLLSSKHKYTHFSSPSAYCSMFPVMHRIKYFERLTNDGMQRRKQSFVTGRAASGK